MSLPDSPIYFELGGVSIPFSGNLVMQQSYTPLMGARWPPERTMNGGAVRRVSFTGKLGTVASCTGWTPAGFDGLDWSQPMLMKCAAPRCIQGAGNVIELPAGRRSESYFAPRGYAVVGGRAVASEINVVGNDATVTTVAGATAYEVWYWPQVTVIARPVRVSGQLDLAEYQWTLEAEEQ